MDAQADLSLRWAHSHFAGFVVSRLIFFILWKSVSGDRRLYLNLVMRKRVFGVFDQVRLKPACSAIETT